MPVQPKRSAGTTLRRDFNAEFVALARMTREKLLEDRMAIARLAELHDSLVAAFAVVVGGLGYIALGVLIWLALGVQ